MDNIGNFIRQYRGNISLRDFASKCHISHTHLDSIEKGFDPRTGKPVSVTVETLKKIANAMNLSVNDLLLQSGEVNIKDIHYDNAVAEKTPPDTIKIPVLGRIPAGIPFEAIEDIIDYEEIPREWLKGGKEYFGLQIEGNSMEPEYKHHDILIVLKENDCESGQDAIVMVNGDDATFKRVIKQDDNIILKPLNNEYNPTVFTEYDILTKPVKIIGVVKEIRRKVN